MKILFISSGNSRNGINPIIFNQGESLKKYLMLMLLTNMDVVKLVELHMSVMHIMDCILLRKESLLRPITLMN